MIPNSRARTIWKPFEAGVTGTQLARPVFLLVALRQRLAPWLLPLADFYS